MNFEIKSETKVTGVTVEMTPGMVRAIWTFTQDYWARDDLFYVQWERVIKAMEQVGASD